AQQADKRKSGVTGLLAKPEFTEKWETLLVLQYKDLIAMLPPGDSWLQGTQNKISLVYLTQARKLRKKDSFPQALTMIRKGKRYLPGHPEFGTEHQAITAAETAHNKAQAEEARLAEIKGLKRTLLTQATADKILDARNTLEKLRKELPATDPFMAKEGPDAIGQAYMRLAKGLAAQKKFDQALKQADQGMALAPLLQPLAETRKIYAGEAKIVQLRRNFGKVKTLDVAKTKQDFARIKSLFPKRYPQLTGELGSILGKRIKAMEKTDVLAANDLLSSAKQLLPGNSALGKIKLKTPLKPSKYAARGNQAVNQGKLGQAEIILAEALKKEKDHPEVARFRTALEKRKRQAESEFAKAKQAIKFKKKSLAKTSLQKATSLWADNQAYRKELERISTSTAKAIKRVAGGGRPCKPGLAGYGTRARATCFDMLAKKQKGPVLVVVPTGSGVPKPFAISKYEISVSDFNLYCKLSGSCPGIPGKDGKLPVTNITLQQAEAYAKWLTEKTGNLYRLPKENEWAYAATAKGPPKKRDFNCRVTLGGNLIKGHAMMNVRAGVQNGWGLKHFLGNAQEWVMNGSGVVARGGAYTDPLSKCKLSLTRQHSGKADDITSFRLVMEIG
ncbi:MAG: SUMF1/EgtB/PvdO family nonheme iron enzyme, partial [Gammaproteobacteria bacterium]|nr:SUMF1/EgtB/PvdO family nonheme iron enzyme [Gammaproteobacteria bacterium]